MSKYTNEANISHYKALLHAIKYLIDRKHYLYKTEQE